MSDIDPSLRVDEIKPREMKEAVAGCDRLLVFDKPTDVYEVMHHTPFTVESFPVSNFRDENWPAEDAISSYDISEDWAAQHEAFAVFEAGPEIYLVPQNSPWTIYQQLQTATPGELDPEEKTPGSETTQQETLFPYPGGKGRYSEWITEQLLDTRVYVEPFAGSAAVFLSRDPSPSEILNDTNDDLFTFYTVAKEKPHELVDWIEKVPYARRQYREWVSDWMAGRRPDDPVEHAARFWTIQQMNQMGKLDSEAGFKTKAKYPASRTFYNAKQHLERMVSRFSDVTLECREYHEILDLYDTSDTLFYLDPPYLGKEDTYNANFDHDTLAAILPKLEGYVALSYEEIPSAIPSDELVIRENTARRRQGGQQQATTERLLLNYNPDTGDRVDLPDPNPDAPIEDVVTPDTQQTLAETFN